MIKTTFFFLATFLKSRTSGPTTFFLASLVTFPFREEVVAVPFAATVLELLAGFGFLVVSPALVIASARSFYFGLVASV